LIIAFRLQPSAFSLQPFAFSLIPPQFHQNHNLLLPMRALQIPGQWAQD
jgi:hypothetical protein